MTDKFDWLRDHVTGAVFVPGETGYAAECSTFNLLTPLTPPVVVGATGVADVEAAVRFASANEMPVAVRGAGHSQPHQASDAVLITLDRMTAVQIDEDSAVARIAGGARWGDVVDATAPLGLAAPVGSATTVGAIGYVLGGGQSPILGRAYGYASDYVTEFEVVTADGVRRTANEVENADLFQALKGSRGNFGVVTAMRIALLPVETLVAGGLYFPGNDAPRVIRAWRDWAAKLPDAATTSVSILRVAPMPHLPQVLRGQFVTAIRFAYAGPVGEAVEQFAPMRALGPAMLDTVEEVPFATATTMHYDPPTPVPFLERGMALSDFTDEAINALIKVDGPGSYSPLGNVEIRALGGALDRAPAPDANPGRGAAYQVVAVGRGTANDSPAVLTALDALEQALQPWREDRQPPNSMTPEQAGVDEVRRVYGPELFDRLATLKAKYDPDNLFRVNYNIPPAL
ncbi:FAD-binding oxidoreductase [Actinoplanes sp. TBRC 11911]|uniref:FAD-binding oxidoreductase n=1 Tax=Actinoplanes sp. TBRC 11911 TaxID=2729386 RepID=UPI0028990F74|nr:FAD-binding oxidoreductase [Actinoplanes sp. TBRC 11911]